MYNAIHSWRSAKLSYWQMDEMMTEGDMPLLTWSHIKSISWHLYINISLKCAWYIYIYTMIYIYYTKNITNRSRGRTQPIYVWHLSFPPLQGSIWIGYGATIWNYEMIQSRYHMGWVQGQPSEIMRFTILACAKLPLFIWAWEAPSVSVVNHLQLENWDHKTICPDSFFWM